MPAMDGKIERRVCIKFLVKLGKSATETLQMLRETPGKHSFSRSSVLNGTHVSRLVKCELNMTNIQGYKTPVKR
jgi:hypothetical protein